MTRLRDLDELQDGDDEHETPIEVTVLLSMDRCDHQGEE